MGGWVKSIPFHVFKRHFTSISLIRFRLVMATRRSTFAGGEKEADSRVRSLTDTAFLKSPKKTCSCLELVRETIPALTECAHKGQMGRIGVIGGCQEYTGAPYFAAISALKAGADLSHVFCTSDASVVIKSYSPELIVHPLLDKKTAVKEVKDWLSRLHCLVIGPGMGRNPTIIENVKGVLELAKEQNKLLVIDADGLFMVTSYPEIVKNYTKAILTPNAMEFSRLYNTMFGREPDPSIDSSSHVTQLCREFGGVTICRKGQEDILADGKDVVHCTTEGSNRRCGGQGDLLSGSMGVFFHWADTTFKKKTKEERACAYGRTLVAAYGACALTRTCNRLAFAKYKRNMTTTDMIAEIHDAFQLLFPEKKSDENVTRQEHTV
ncbi:unnamed protein product [Porites lobata]|uniref:ATP-dependent (S)-NAD(P)H-hydrate dehydratase n=1 Tax=Porites lobata TaxID=104759 RepID=A0ABN8NZM1_9CNID|nr:unnamed protein product [Porites lobata]